MSDLKPIEPTLSAHDATLIQRALDTIPAECRYHGDNLERDYGMHGTGSCCDTGKPSLYRREAEAALTRACGECPSCHTPNGRPHTDYCQAKEAKS